jgi:predicted porin
MKKTLIALAALAAVGVASAQSNATISGTFAAGYVKALNGDKGLLLDTNTINVAVTEDLGGGLKLSASTQISGNSQRGGTVTKDDSTLGLSGKFGSLTFANTRFSSTAVGTGAVADIWLNQGAYDSNEAVFGRFPMDALLYTSPDFSGANVTLGYVEAADDGAGTPAAKMGLLAANYSNGKLSAAVRFLQGSGTVFTTGLRKSSWDMGVNYDLGMVKLGAGLDSKRFLTEKSDNTEKMAYVLSASAPVGAATVGVNYYVRNKDTIVELGAKYDLSKRSSIYASFGQAKVQNYGTDKSDTTKQYGLYLVHNF